MAEPSSTAMVAAAVTTLTSAALATAFPQYALVVAGGLIGALYALMGEGRMQIVDAIRYLFRALLPAILVGSLGASLVSHYSDINLQELFFPVSGLIAAFHRQLFAKGASLIFRGSKP